MKKSFSKKGSCLSFLTGGISREETNFELMRISLKKQIDRKQKLESLLEKYTEIRAQQKTHIKAIKSSIIELKDTQQVSKIKFLVDPNIYVDNNLSIQTREFLCLLLNTFYKRYNQNASFEKEAVRINDQIKTMIKSISYNEEMLFKVQKQNINHQVQMEGELLSEKNKLKEQKDKTKEFQAEKNRVNAINLQHKAKYEQQKEKVCKLQKEVENLEQSILKMNQKINRGEQIRQGNQQKMSDQLIYQMRFEDEILQLKIKIEEQEHRYQQLVKKIAVKKKLIDKKKGLNRSQLSQHNSKMKVLDLNYPKISATAVEQQDINVLGERVKTMKINESIINRNDGIFF